MKKIVLKILVLVFTTSAYTQELPLGVGIGSWNPKLSGTTGTRVSPNYDIKDDYGISQKSDSTYLWLEYKGERGFIPRYRFETSELSFEGKTTKEVLVRDKTFSLNSETEILIKEYNNIIYYTLFEDIVSIDLGINFKTYDGYMRVKGNNLEQKEDFDDTSALYYFGASYNVDDLTIIYDIKYASDGDSKIKDQQIKLKYLPLKSELLCLGVEAGYKKEIIKIDEEGVSYKGDLTIEGLFAGIIARF